MENGFFLITGTSKGIGEAVARKLIQEGHTVLGVSRSRSSRLESSRYLHLSLDLSETSGLNTIVEKADELVGGGNFDSLCLIHNAAMLTPIGPIERCAPAEIEAHITVGLVAPMILTSLFIQRFSSAEITKKLVFISSGLAFTPMKDSSIYCGAKAGLNLFSQCVGLEQEGKDHGFEVCSIGPGKVETGMQQTMRAKSTEEFANADFFRKAYEEGDVADPDDVAEKIAVILGNTYEQGKYVSVRDV